jgi:short-subunit dehydrogenase
MLRERRGTIVTVSSVLGHLGAANLSAYAASKAGLLALHHSLRAELAQTPNAEEIKTILVTPGQMSTQMFAGVKTPNNFLAPLVTPAEIAKSIIKLIERGESGDIALPLYSRYVAFLAILPFGLQQLVRRLSGLDTAVSKARGGNHDTGEKK